MEGFWKVVIGAEGEPFDTVVGGAGGGEHQDHRRIFAVDDDLAELIAVDAGEVAVEDDDLVGVKVDLRHRLGPVVCDVDGDSLVAHSFCDPVGVARHVLDDEHPHVAATASRWMVAAGRVIWTRRPPSARAWSSRLPACAVATAATIDSPSPWPFCDPVRSCLRRLDGWASCATASWWSIGPLLSIITRARWSSSRVSLSSIEPPGWLWRTAFSITFSIMRASRVALPTTSTASSCISTLSRSAAIWLARALSAAVTSGSSATRLCSSSGPFWARARVRKHSSSWSAWSRSTRSSASSSWVAVDTRRGFAIAR